MVAPLVQLPSPYTTNQKEGTLPVMYSASLHRKLRGKIFIARYFLPHCKQGSCAGFETSSDIFYLGSDCFAVYSYSEQVDELQPV